MIAEKKANNFTGPLYFILPPPVDVQANSASYPPWSCRDFTGKICTVLQAYTSFGERSFSNAGLCVCGTLCRRLCDKTVAVDSLNIN